MKRLVFLTLLLLVSPLQAQNGKDKPAVIFPAQASSLDMLPPFLVNDKTDQALTDRIFVRQLTMRNSSTRISVTNLSDFFIGQFGFDVSFPTRCPTFACLIKAVIFLCAYEKMDRIDASRIVASVENRKPVWNWTNHQFIRNSVRLEHCFTAISSSDHLAISISFDAHTTCPKNTSGFRLFSYFAKENIVNWNTFTRHAATSDKVQCVGAAHQRRSVILGEAL